MVNTAESKYLELLSDIMTKGAQKGDRTGVGIRSYWGAQLRFDLQEGFPLLTTRQLSARLGIEEMLFFLRGQTDTKILEDKKITIWSGNTSRDFLDKRGLSHLPEGDMGRGYGHQMRNFGGTDDKPGFDQLRYLVDNIKNNPDDRRHYMNYWHPQVLTDAALPPCHLSFNCQVVDGRLNSCFYMRSSDVYHGLPHNIVSYAFLTHMIAEITGYQAGELVYMGADCHVYNSQIEVVAEQLQRAPFDFPKFKFLKKFDCLDSALQMEYSDIEIIGYKHQGKLKNVPMAV